MKNVLSILLILFGMSTVSAVSQEVKLFANQPKDSVVRINPTNQNNEFLAGEILVKFKDDVNIQVSSKGSSVLTTIPSVDKLFQKHRVKDCQKLFPGQQRQREKVMLRNFNGQLFEKPNLHNIYRITFSEETPIFIILEDIKEDANVEYAEPNYILSITDARPVSEILSPNDIIEGSDGNNRGTTMVPDDPLYSQQWYIPAVSANLVWDSVSEQDTSQVIAILDTGVDWLHPDLINKIWTNPDETPGNGYDDDGNGKVDDIRGWDWVNNDPNTMDDNNHGTHVAGIASAERNNGIGISGVSQAKLMPLKAFSSAGFGTIYDIVQAVDYAVSKGATVINMSFGTYARSFVLESALMNAYSSCDLVAAAGNDKESIYMTSPVDVNASLYPAALPYVLGIQAEENYSNFDPDGPVYSISDFGLNYELRAPGSGLISTARNGSYITMTGTSMAAPVVSGSVALYKAFHPDRTREEMWGDLINSSSLYIDILTTCTNDNKHPVLNLVEFHSIDTLAGDDSDGQADAGELIQLWIKIKNTYAFADSVFAILRQTNTGDTADINIITDSVFFGSISSYASITNEYLPFLIQIDPESGNNRTIELQVVLGNIGDSSNFNAIVSFKIYNGEELSGILTQNKTLTPDKNWIINNSLRIGTGVTLTILPGTIIDINAIVDNRGYVHAVGNQDSLIIMNGMINGNTKLEYVKADLKGQDISVSRIIKNTEIINLYSISTPKIIDSYVHDMGYNNYGLAVDSVVSSVIENVYVRRTNYARESIFRNIRIGYYGNIFRSYFNIFDEIYSTDSENSYLFLLSNDVVNPYQKNSFLSNNPKTWFGITSGSLDYVILSNQYWGTTDLLKIREKYHDFWQNSQLPFLITSPILTMPSDSCPGHVWKIMVNNLDAQDDIKEPLGVGTHKFEVFFNKPMDINYTPQLSFGVTFPYTQQLISDSASWSSDLKIWTAYKKIELFTGDGINQLRVDNARDLNGIKIPLEDDRFNFIIQAAGSASMDFIASPGLGKINLEWNNVGIEDLLGFNMYRFQNITDSTFTNPVLINATLITDTLYTDFDVLPNVRYYYYYKVLRTDFAESDSSKVISAIPLTASIGDANGDLVVNVLDITTIVSYLINNNPQPFIFEAADVNADNSINVLDIVGVVNLVTGGAKSGQFILDGIAHLYIENDTLFADAPTAAAGIQFDINGVTIEEIEILAALKGFETGYGMISNSLRMVFYSMSGRHIPAGNRIPLMKIGKSAWLSNTIMADNSGNPLMIDERPYQGKVLSTKAVEVKQNYPNPFTGQTIIPVVVYEPVDQVVVRIVNMYGQVIRTLELTNPELGEHLLKVNNFSSGILAYSVEIRRGNNKYILPVKKMVSR